MKWEPIDSAPWGESILVEYIGTDGRKYVSIAEREEETGIWWWEDGNRVVDRIVIYGWMHMPKPLTP